MEPTVAYHPPSHRRRLENSDIDESPPLTFLMWFVNKWDFSISQFIASTRGSLSSLCFLEGRPSFHTVQESTWGHTETVKGISFLYC